MGSETVGLVIFMSCIVVSMARSIFTPDHRVHPR